jgi:hypothetical protein
VRPYKVKAPDGLPFEIYDLHNVEYWMLCDEFDETLITVANPDECVDKLEYYHQNSMEAYEIAKRGFDFAHKILSKENVMLYWKILLETYASRFANDVNKNNVDRQQYKIPFL